MDLNHVRQLMRSLYWSAWEREMNHIATGTALSLDGELLPPHGRQQRWWWWRWCWWRSLPGVLPRPRGVPEQRLLSPRSWLRDGGGSGRFLVPWLFRIEDLGQGPLNRRRGGVGRVTGAPHNRGARPPWAAPPYCLVAMWLSSGASPVFWKLRAIIRCWALISSNSENISLLGFLKPKTAENRNWHFGILSIG